MHVRQVVEAELGHNARLPARLNFDYRPGEASGNEPVWDAAMIVICWLVVRRRPGFARGARAPARQIDHGEASVSP